MRCPLNNSRYCFVWNRPSYSIAKRYLSEVGKLFYERGKQRERKRETQRDWERLSNWDNMRAPLARWTASIGARILSGDDDEDEHEEDVSASDPDWAVSLLVANRFPTLSFCVYPGLSLSCLIIAVSWIPFSYKVKGGGTLLLFFSQTSVSTEPSKFRPHQQKQKPAS